MKKIMTILTIMCIMALSCRGANLQREMELKQQLVNITQEYEMAILKAGEKYQSALSGITGNTPSDSLDRMEVKLQYEADLKRAKEKFQKEQTRILKELADMGVYV